MSTHTPDLPSTPVACQVQAHFGIAEAGAYDLNATCAGFAYALHTASALVAAGVHHKILVIGGDALSKITDYTDRSTCILFGDGAGAVVVEREEAQPAFLAHHMGSDGTGAKHVYRTGLATELNGNPLLGRGSLSKTVVKCTDSLFRPYRKASRCCFKKAVCHSRPLIGSSLIARTCA